MKTTIDKNFFEKWKDGKVVMHCSKKEYAKKFCELMDGNGLEWADEESYLNRTLWGTHKEDTCYRFNSGKYESFRFFKRNNYTILEFEDFIIPDKEPKEINEQWFNYWKNKKAVMSCHSEVEALAFCRIMHKRGMTWFNGRSYLYNNHSSVYGRGTCYNFNNGYYGDLAYYQAKGWVILKFGDYITQDILNLMCEVDGLDEDETRGDFFYMQGIKNPDTVCIQCTAQGLIIEDIGIPENKFNKEKDIKESNKQKGAIK